ncbi:MAG: radical SAM protein [Candidatus Saelkia tenebricola]|nr:radical SAM protein [Candidatus Saelkia tenebricola]
MKESNLVELNSEIISMPETVSVEELVVEEGLSPCPSCEKLVPAKTVVRDGYTYIVKHCVFERKFFNVFLGKGWYDKSYKDISLPNSWPRCEVHIGQKEMSEKNVLNIGEVSFVLLTITKKCNIHCKICYDKLLADRIDMSLSHIEDKLRFFKNRTVILFGGEPTVREDLPEIIKLVKLSNNYPVLFTNGIKLTSRDYLNCLIKNGLWGVCLSFDGFDAHIYAELRGLDEKVYQQKLEALENLKKTNIPVVIHSTIVKEVNEHEVAKILDYAAQNDFVSAVWFRTLYLSGEEKLSNFDKTNLISEKEMVNMICSHLDIDKEYFYLWDEVKRGLVKWITKRFPKFKISVFRLGRIYLIRKKGKFHPVLTIRQLKDIKVALETNRYFILLSPCLLKWFVRLAVNGFSIARIERTFYKEAMVFKICLEQLGPYPNIMFSNQHPITLVEYNRGRFFAAQSYID